ncbi:hypothetical protein F5890DRAFT_1601467 [Lentinula detonsa]|uniref:Uncharacterized protein n=1 Tax=Lentinula detonsa TaxID=2804962 RepID=A0AA38US43_9AGAR|nr:hypothetical protein F5890DRAFT_1601467 [Lentinula detonsa]
MELDEDEGPSALNDDDGSGFMPILSSGDWEDDDTMEEEEHLLYFQAKGTIHDLKVEHRSRKNKTILDQERWEEQMSDLVEAYLDHCYHRRLGHPFEETVKERHTILVWSVFEHSLYDIPVFQCDRLQNASYIRSGFLPFNPLLNKSLVSLQTVELYHHLFMRCPHLGVQPFLRALCDLQGVRFKNNLSVQFSSAYDLYIRLTKSVRSHVTGGVASSRQLGLGLGQSNWILCTSGDLRLPIAGNQLLSPLGVAGPAQFLTTLGSLTPRTVTSQVLTSLDRTTPNWRMLNACPPLDGNNSLKRFERWERKEDGTLLGPTREKPDVQIQLQVKDQLHPLRIGQSDLIVRLVNKNKVECE